jgi:uncharacterized protein YcaQ
MKNKIVLSQQQAGRIVLEQQLLGSSNALPPGKAGAAAAVAHLGYVQIDTLSVIMRAHHHVLWTRTPGYKESHLNELVREKQLFEYWSHAAAFLPMHDFRFSMPRKMAFRNGDKHWFEKNKKMIRFVLDRIKAEGPLKAKDFETDRVRGSWFDWKPAKQALEQLFQEGYLMVAERAGFQKVYDLTERVLPAGTNTTTPTPAEYADYLVQQTLRAQGLITAKDVAYLRKNVLKPVTSLLREMTADGQLLPVEVKGIGEVFWITPERLNRKTVVPKKLRLLSPFDNSIIRRQRLQQLFGYDFMIECYLPEPKRKFGYFCLPVLHGEHFIGRLDPKADRATGIFHVKALHMENKPADAEAFYKALTAELRRFAAHHGCAEIRYEKAVPAAIRKKLEKL